MLLRFVIFALTLYAILATPCRLTAAERPRQCPLPPQAPAVRACICGDSCVCPAGACPSRCPVVVQAAPVVQYQLYQVTQGRRTWYEYRAVTAGVTAQSGCANGQCPLPRR